VANFSRLYFALNVFVNVILILRSRILGHSNHHHHRHHHHHHHHHRRCRLSRIRPLGLLRFRIYFLKLIDLLDSCQDSLDGESARRKASTCTVQHNTERRGHTSIPRVGFELTTQCSSGRRQYVPQIARPLGSAN